MTSALLCLSRENAFVWLPILGLGLWSGCGAVGGRRRAIRVGLFALGAAVVLFPVGLRNRLVGGEWSFSTFQAGPNFYIGNHRGASGRYEPLVRGHETPEHERADATRLAEEAEGWKLSPREVSRYWTRRALRDIGDDPAGWLGLMFRKMLMVWNRYEISDVESIYVYAEESLLLRGLLAVGHFGVLVPLAAVGVAATWHQRQKLWVEYALIASMALAVALFYVMGRYRYPLVPLLIPFAAAGLVRLWEDVSAIVWHLKPTAAARETVPALRGGHALCGGHATRRGGRVTPARGKRFSGARRLAVAAAVGATVALVVNWPVQDEGRLNAMAYSNLGSVLGAQGDLDGAVRYLRRGVAGHPESAEGHFNLGYALSLKGEHAEAARHFRIALQIVPNLPHADFLLGRSLEALGDMAGAMEHYRRAAALDPSDADAARAMERVEGRNGA
jgi:hypothetical protein